ncbi:MAG: type IV pilus twitching motility protein PilT [Eubacteriales bacterium]|nr:type IV pilus twitching motility protein PilT [Eubacteriales bacterium]
MKILIDALTQTVDTVSSDLHITVGLPPMIRTNTALRPFNDCILKPADTEEMVRFVLSDEQFEALSITGELDFSYTVPGLSRFRVNAYKQRGSYGLAFRVISIKIPTLDSLHFPEVIKNLAMKTRGLILVTGPTGSGKSTTLAAMVDYINSERNCHIITLEEPIEYLHRHGNSMINQREIGTDTATFGSGLRSALREDPDVILVGEMRDLETISTAITAAETGHLVLSTLHTTGAEATIDRVIDVFPAHQQQQVRIQLSSVLEAVVSQLLLPTPDGQHMNAVQEILVTIPAVRNLIRDDKTNQIASIIQTNSRLGMKSLDQSLAEMVRYNQITVDEAYRVAIDKSLLQKFLSI